MSTNDKQYDHSSDKPYTDVNEEKPDGGRTKIQRSDVETDNSAYIGHKPDDVTVKTN
jgi:hypothetical protein